MAYKYVLILMVMSFISCNVSFISCNGRQQIDTPLLDSSIALADMVVIGEAISKEYHDEEGSNTPYFLTTYKIEPEVILKGDAEIDNIEVLTEAGRLRNGAIVQISHTASPRVGLRAVFFLGHIDFGVLRRNADFGLIDMASVNATEGSDEEFNVFEILRISGNRVSTSDGDLPLSQFISKFD